MSRVERAGSLCGVAFSLLVVVGAVVHGGARSDSESGAATVAWYRAHQGAAKLSSVLLAFAFAFLVFFAGSLRRWMQHQPSVEWLASIALAGSAVLAAGQTLSAGFDWAVASSVSHIAPDAAQALHIASADVILMSAAGWFVFSIAAGLAILNSALLPRWFGWASIAIGIIVVTPAEFVAFLAFVAWSAATSIQMVRRHEAIAATA